VRFERIHTVVVYLLVSTGFLVLFLSGELPSVYWLVSLPAVLGSIVVGGRPRYRSVTVWNIILLSAFFILTLFGSSSGDWLLSAVYFASLMVIAKLYQRSTSADYFQLYSLSFLQLVAGAVINPTLSFAVCFVLYVVFLTWALVLLHLRREMERLAAAEAAVEAAAERDTGDTTDTSSGDEATVIASAESWRVQRLVGPGFLAGTSLLAIVIFVCSTAVFLFFPRLGLGFFGQHKRSGERVSGFGNSIELGHFGTMKQDQTIIMRVEIDGKETRTALPLRLKGMSFDRYDGKSWRKSERMMWRLVESGQGGFMRVAPDGEIPAEAPRYTQRIYLERLDIDRRAVFGESKIVAVRDLLNSKHIPNHRDHTRFYQDNDRDLVYTTGDAAPALRYEVISTRVERQPERLREAGSNYPALSKRYLQLPELAPEIRALAQRITAEAENPFDKVGAIERYLMSNYRYSLEGGHDEEDPLKDFLFGRRSGHC
jgi:hypothetical protein